ncbi:MAG: CDP-alcohol phosphatidyltransferase family protein [Nitrospirae bacterium]|nr:CDP-alcohol phosphatidyltransferase family protein [Nitrospirota bacterium]
MLLNIPNILTVVRILLLPLFVAAFMYGKYEYALYVFLLAAATDLFDGLIARLKKQATELGRILDPIADKFFMITSFILMTYYGMIPKWITIVVISRDMFVITGCVITYFISSSLRIEPTLAGKTASALQFIMIGLVLVLYINGGKTPPHALFILTAFFTIASGLQYVYNGLKMINSGNSRA